jgi:hypothetical protein
MLINLLNLGKAYWRGFVGGPDFNCGINHRFILEDKQLTVYMPDSNLGVAPSEINVNFPHTSKRWFTQHEEIEQQHTFVHMMMEGWMYLPPIAIGTSSEYGMLTCELRIKQTNDINVLDKSALSLYVTQACDDYNNGPDGINTELRKRKIKRSSQREEPWTPDELEREFAISIELQGLAPLAPASIRRFNQLSWIFYQETRNNSFSHQDFYCLPLSDNSFLEVRFNHSVDRSDKHKKWANAALAAQERIMGSIYLDDIPLTQDPLITDN